jgi:hypothetical protein
MISNKNLLKPAASYHLVRRVAGMPRAKLSTLAALLLFVPLFSGTHATQAATLVPHVAQYRLSLAQLNIPGEAASAGGDLAIRLERTCSRWRITSRFEFNIDFRDADRRMHVEVATGSEEDLRRQTLLFESHTAVYGVNVLSIKGIVNATEEGGVRAVLAKLEQAELILPKETLLPMFATRRTLNLLERGGRFDSYLLFDGSNSTDPYRVTDVAGGKPLALKQRPAGDADLLDAASCSVTSSFFEPQSVDAEPQSTTTTQNHANGIVSRVLLDVGF